MEEKNISEWNKKYNYKSAEEILKFAFENIEGEFALSSSTSIEDQILTYIIVKNNYPCTFFTLDTGRLPKETYDTIIETEKAFGIKFQVYFPEAANVEKMVADYGLNLFYESLELRKICCNVRKIQPLQRALKGKSAWITGLRREQSVTRLNIPVFENEPHLNLIKVNPIADMQESEVWNIIEKNNIPINSLQRQGFRSFGCQPCSRAISASEDVRAGRWWWEDSDKKECGIHVK